MLLFCQFKYSTLQENNFEKLGFLTNFKISDYDVCDVTGYSEMLATFKHDEFFN